MSSALFLSLLCAGFVALAASQGVHFDCPALPPLTQPAKTVYELKPQDIKVVMALGDSITAGRDDAQQKRKALCSYIYIYIQQWLCMPCQSLPLCLPAGFGMMGAQGSLYNDSLEYRVSCSSAEPPA